LANSPVSLMPGNATGAILVTGATGFIGRPLVQRLEQQGHAVYRFARSMGNDIRDKDAFSAFLGKGIEIVFHLAGRNFVPDSWTNPEDFYAVNTLGTQQALEFCRRERVRMIYVSAYIYGVPHYLPIDEKHPVAPNNPYAHSKWLGEELCRFYAGILGVQTTILRPFNLYGPGQDESFLIPTIIRQAREGKEIVVKDDTPRRDYLHVDDFVEACLAARQAKEPLSIFNVGSGYSVSVREIVEAVIHATGKEMTWRSTGEVRPHEIPDTIADCEAIWHEVNWKSRIKFDVGIRSLLGAGEMLNGD
jgi:nucleoside-diphosphate-sugar epimerase